MTTMKTAAQQQAEWKATAERLKNRSKQETAKVNLAIFERINAHRRSFGATEQDLTKLRKAAGE